LRFAPHLAGRLAVIPALLLVGSLALVACGDDDDGGGGNGSDESYLRALCNSMSTFQADFEELAADFDPSSTSDLEDFMSEAADVVAQVVDDLEDANPPADVEEVHQSFIDLFSQFRDALEEGDFGSLENFEEPDIDVDPAVEDRLDGVAQGIDECQDLGLFEE
jgi:hypothetical protein